MAKKRYISDIIWTDSWFENKTPEQKLLFIYLITNKLVSICGFYEISIRQISFDTGINIKDVEKYIKEFQENKKIFYNNGIICIVNFVKNQNIKSIEDNLWKGIQREIKELGQEKLNNLLNNKELTRALQGAYKEVPIPYLTLLNLTLPNLTSPNLSDIVENNNNSKELQQSGNTKIKKREDIDNIINILKETADSIGLAYNKENERNFAKHILTAKEYGEFCQKIGQDRIEFAKNIMIVSSKIGYWKGPCAGPMTIYQNYSEVYNKALDNKNNLSYNKNNKIGILE